MEKTVPFIDNAAALRVDRLTVRVVDGPDRDKSKNVATGVLTVGTASDNDLVLTDTTVSRYHLDLEPHPSGVAVRDNGSTNGSFAGGIAIERAVVPAGTTLRLGRTQLEINKDTGDDPEIFAGMELGGVLGQTPAMRRLMSQIDRVARTQVGVTILGESGTGKEVVAGALHALSERSSRPFVTVDCGALTPGLVASELFGHERGAFTGADRQYAGALERAHGGTLLLDEIGELPIDLQPVLLGALERRRIRRVGGKAEIPIDVRVLAATHRDLRADVNVGKFRLDLYYRLAVVVLRIPPLREHRGDIPMLVRHFLKDCGRGSGPDLFDDGMLQSLQNHHWPGNIRELRNFVEATVALGAAPQNHLESHGETLIPPAEAIGEARALAENGSSNGANGHVSRHDGLELETLLPRKYKDARDGVLKAFEHKYLEHWLMRSGGNVARAARNCEMDRSHMFQMLRRHGLR